MLSAYKGNVQLAMGTVLLALNVNTYPIHAYSKYQTATKLCFSDDHITNSVLFVLPRVVQSVFSQNITGAVIVTGYYH